jgi:DnaK suppressor protein
MRKMKDTDQIKQRITEEIISTRDLVLKYRELTKPIAPENAIGRVSRMDAINNKSVNEAALRKAETKLKNLQVALSKIDDPDFGICLKCKNEIPLGRIMLLPHVVTCVNCAN